MPVVARTRQISAAPERVWRLIADPHNLPRWWPDTVRVEDVQGDAGTRRSRFTQVFSTSKGKPVRADYRCSESTEGRRLLWEQEIDGTPFEGFLRSAALEIRLNPGSEGSEGAEVTLEGKRRMRGLSRLGSPMMKRATGRTLDAALAGIDEVLTARESAD